MASLALGFGPKDSRVRHASKSTSLLAPPENLDGLLEGRGRSFLGMHAKSVLLLGGLLHSTGNHVSVVAVCLGMHLPSMPSLSDHENDI